MIRTILDSGDVIHPELFNKNFIYDDSLYRSALDDNIYSLNEISLPLIEIRNSFNYNGRNSILNLNNSNPTSLIHRIISRLGRTMTLGNSIISLKAIMNNESLKNRIVFLNLGNNNPYYIREDESYRNVSNGEQYLSRFGIRRNHTSTIDSNNPFLAAIYLSKQFFPTDEILNSAKEELIECFGESPEFELNITKKTKPNISEGSTVISRESFKMTVLGYSERTDELVKFILSRFRNQLQAASPLIVPQQQGFSNCFLNLVNLRISSRSPYFEYDHHINIPEFRDTARRVTNNNTTFNYCIASSVSNILRRLGVGRLSASKVYSFVDLRERDSSTGLTAQELSICSRYITSLKKNYPIAETLFRGSPFTIPRPVGTTETGEESNIRGVYDNSSGFNENDGESISEEEINELTQQHPRRSEMEPAGFDYVKSKYSLSTFCHKSGLERFNKNSEKEVAEFEERLKILNCRNGTDSQTNLIMQNKPYTFGVEIETISGSFDDPEEVKHLNVKAVHDGSLRDVDSEGRQVGEPKGKEYVTGVLYGDDGFKQLYDIFTTLQTKCSVDKRCSVHVHMGTLNWNSSDIAAAYLLGLMLEEDIFKMLPASRRGNVYCKDLLPIDIKKLTKGDPTKARNKEEYKERVDDIYNTVFTIVSRAGRPSKKYNKLTVHPSGRHGGYDRQYDHRYSWLNFTNMIFNQRGSIYYKTIELRNHSGTLNFEKGKNWVLIMAAFCDYVHNFKDEIFRVFFKTNGNYRGVLTLEDLIKNTFEGKGQISLLKYVEKRKKLFLKDSSKQEKSDYLEKTITKLSKRDLICV